MKNVIDYIAFWVIPVILKKPKVHALKNTNFTQVSALLFKPSGAIMEKLLSRIMRTEVTLFSHRRLTFIMRIRTIKFQKTCSQISMT